MRGTADPLYRYRARRMAWSALCGVRDVLVLLCFLVMQQACFSVSQGVSEGTFVMI